jgi:hypothetical protein
MRRDLSELFAKQEIFWDLQEVAKENKNVLAPGAFFDWMCQNHVVAVSVGIRSFVDQRIDSRSLWRMLYEILEHRDSITRDFHVQMYARAPGLEYGHRTFDNVVGRGRTTLRERDIRSDLRRIENASERVRRFVNKRIAHRTAPGEMRRLPKFNELDAALTALDEVLCKYNLLLTAQGMDTVKATRQYSWQDVLHAPWVLPGSRLRP